jgi:hypothetical protein
MKLAELLRKVMQPAKADRSSPAGIPRNKSQGTKKPTNLTERNRMKFENSDTDGKKTDNPMGSCKG